MQTQTAGEEFSDFKSHTQMYSGYTGMLFRGSIGVAVLLIFIAWVTGVF
jgi:hypothetical protein